MAMSLMTHPQRLQSSTHCILLAIQINPDARWEGATQRQGCQEAGITGGILEDGYTWGRYKHKERQLVWHKGICKAS